MTLSPNTNYYATDSDGLTKFKLSTTRSTAGSNVVVIPKNATANPNQLIFTRKDPVNQPQIINYIQPNIQDTRYSYLDGTSINGAVDTIQARVEISELSMNEKYRGDQDTNTNDSIKFEGSINLHDPDDYNQTGSLVKNEGITGAPAPGVYIGDTRAFSSDNNPWEETGNADGTGKLETESEEVSIGELAFLDGNNSMVITGIDNDVSTVSGVVASSFTHKIPIQVQDGSGNKESYYLLVSTSSVSYTHLTLPTKA